jgi:hypothetical protein
VLVPSQRHVLDLRTRFAAEHGVALRHQIRGEDFIGAAARALDGGLFGAWRWPEFDVAILNPPHKKVRPDSDLRRLLRRLGIETRHLYTAFVALALHGLLEEARAAPQLRLVVVRLDAPADHLR